MYIMKKIQKKTLGCQVLQNFASKEIRSQMKIKDDDQTRFGLLGTKRFLRKNQNKSYWNVVYYSVQTKGP